MTEVQRIGPGEFLVPAGAIVENWVPLSNRAHLVRSQAGLKKALTVLAMDEEQVEFVEGPDLYKYPAVLLATPFYRGYHGIAVRWCTLDNYVTQTLERLQLLANNDKRTKERLEAIHDITTFDLNAKVPGEGGRPGQGCNP